MFVPITVIEELEWVLRGIYEMPADEITAVLEPFLQRPAGSTAAH